MANEIVIPQLRFPEFNDKWKVKAFGDLYKFKTTNSFSRDNLNYDKGEVKNIHYGDIHTKFKSQFDITKELVPFINEDIDITRINDENYLIEGDLVIADASEDYADIGKSIEIVNLNNEKVLSGLHTILARRKSEEEIAISFASFIIKTNRVRQDVMKIAQGSKVLSLSATRLAKIIFFIPKLEEQSKIANFIGKVDFQIQLLVKEKELLKKYKQAVSQKIFNQEIRFKDDNGNDFSDWEEKKLGEITKYYDGTHQTPKYVKSGIPFYTVEHLTANQFRNTKFISEEVFEKENTRVKLEKGDILMTRIGSVGVVKHIDWDVKASFYVSLALIKQNKSFDSKFLSYAIANSKFQKELWKRTIHVAFPQKINLGEIGECIIKIPSLKEQQKIALFLSTTDFQIEQTNKQIEWTMNFRKGLLQRMFV